MTQSTNAIFSFFLVFASIINSHDAIAQKPSAQLSFTQEVPSNVQNKAQIFKKNIPVALNTIGATLKIAFAAAPLIVFTHHVPRLTAGMHPLGAIAYTAGCALCAGIAGGIIGSAFNKK